MQVVVIDGILSASLFFVEPMQARATGDSRVAFDNMQDSLA
jgi:hypothetical protein